MITVHSTELKQALNDLKTIKKSEKAKQFYRIRHILERTVDLYGVVSKDFLLSLWRQAHPDVTFTVVDYERFFLILSILLVDETSYFSDDQYVASAEFNEIEDALIFKNATDKAFGNDFYIPPREELLSPLNKSFRTKEKAYKELKRFIHNVSWDPNEAMEMLDFHLKVGSGFKSVIEDLLVDDVLHFHKANKATRFAELYANAANQSREWQLHGYTRIEVSDRFKGLMYDPVKMDTSLLMKSEDRLLSISSGDVFTSPQPVTNPYRNVSWNDPCPCGSGKKFKKCCGK